MMLLYPNFNAKNLESYKVLEKISFLLADQKRLSRQRHGASRT